MPELHSSEYLLPQELYEVSPVTVVSHRVADFLYLLCCNVTSAEGNLFWAGHHQPLPFLDGLNIERCIHQRFVRTCIQPRHAPSHDHNFQLAAIEVCLVDIGNL